MVIQALLNMAAKRLAEENNPTPRLDAAVLLCYVLECDRTYLVMHTDQEAPPLQEQQYRQMIEKRASGMPVAYLTGTREFMSLDFIVNESVLIPRADTETLVEYVLTEIGENKNAHIADLCCGSGCIGVSLAYYIPSAHVTMVDVSDKAIAVASSNAMRHQVQARCRFVCTDLLHNGIDGQFDVVVSNPPYIETDVIRTLERDVAGYEPHIALDGGVDGFVFYRRLAQLAPDMLSQDGLLALEVGHTQADVVANLLKADFYDIKTARDLAGIRRVVSGRRK